MEIGLEKLVLAQAHILVW